MEPRIGRLPDQNPPEQQPYRRKLRSHKPDQNALSTEPSIRSLPRQPYTGRQGRSCRLRGRIQPGKPHLRKRASSSSSPSKAIKTSGAKTTRSTRKGWGSRSTQQSASSLQLLTHPVTRPDSGDKTVSSRPNRVADPDYELWRRDMMEEFRKTGDYNAFADFVAPFLKRDDETDLADWELDMEKGRYRRVDKSTNQLIWAPTMDSFR